MKITLRELRQVIREVVTEWTDAPEADKSDFKPGFQFKLCHMRYEVLADQGNVVKVRRLSDDEEVEFKKSELVKVKARELDEV